MLWRGPVGGLLITHVDPLRMKPVIFSLLAVLICGCAGTRVIDQGQADGKRLFDIYYHGPGVGLSAYRRLALPARYGRIDGAEVKNARIPGGPPLPTPGYTGYLIVSGDTVEIALEERSRKLPFNGIHRVRPREN